VIENRDNINEELKPVLEEICHDEEKAQQILDASKVSMGQEMSDSDKAQIHEFCARVVEQIDFRESLQEYLKERMDAVAPNLSSLIGETVGSKLIAHAGSLISLAKYPASTVQILGAEKALFRALKTKGKTPKYGLIFNSTFIGRAGQKNKGKVSRYLANKCSIASRFDAFGDCTSGKMGNALKEQMEERLKFLSSGTKPRKNKDAMSEVLDELKSEGLYYKSNVTEENKKEKKVKKDKKTKKRTRDADSDEEEAELEEAKPKKKKSKK
jgi:nucleolar protein 56